MSSRRSFFQAPNKKAGAESNGGCFMSTKANNDNHANQLNPNSAAHKSGQDNRSNQMNPNHAPSKGGGKGGKK